ncbi:MAG: hypothetical protein NTX63_00305 [Candidatus Peregrinibacteria bacterium]|nr:hypothetical protein [Candidatus Peregrinibacteria bacterium]
MSAISDTESGWKGPETDPVVLAANDGIAADILAQLGLDRSATAREVYKILGVPVSPFPITPDRQGGSYYDQVDRALPGTKPQYGHGINASNDAGYLVRQIKKGQ